MTAATLTSQSARSATQDRVAAEYQFILASGEHLHGRESDIVAMFREAFQCGEMEDRIPQSPCDTIVYEMAFRFGRADIVVFHLDGTASVIEVKDGSKGYNHVVAGIGQASLYAAQLAMSKGAVSMVRKCLLWTSTGNLIGDGLIESACEQSATIALPWPSLRACLSAKKAAANIAGGI